MSLMRFWPTEQNVLDCMKPEAENPLDAVFLAIHQPMKLKRRQFDSDVAQDGTEHDLLNDFLREDLPTGTLLVPILGKSGIGKSHLVRWLDVQLRQRSDKDKRHVIRFPKSSSLKTVLRRILEGLDGSRYDKIRRQLKSAREQMDGIQATERIRAELLTAIRRRTALAMERKARARETGGAVDPNDERWIGHGERRCLPALLSDPITSRMLMERHGERSGMIAELARHLAEDTTVEQAPRRQFEEADFEIPDDLQSEISSQAGPPAKKYLRRLEQTSGQARRDATELLNEIIDDAIAPLATPADTSLSELFYAVRRELLAEGRELVLLAEDFAALAGIRGALLDAMIREGVRGEREACVMRTALAVTEGYFKSYETVRTRAVFAWYIDEIPDDTEVQTINRICDFSGAYLNAARFGADELTKYCPSDSHDQSWVPDFVDTETLTDTDSQQLEAFGHSPSGRALFPLNRHAIAAVADWKMRHSDDRLRFNPRTIINDLLIPVVREYRQQFEREEFPPDWFLSYDPDTLGPDVRSQIGERHRNPQEQKRLCALVRFWGGNPSDMSELRLPKEVYETFGLPTLEFTSKLPPHGIDIQPATDQPKVTGREMPRPKPEPKPSRNEPPEVTTWLARLERWSQRHIMGHRDANALRGMIVDGVTAMIDWDAELLRPLRSTEMNKLKDWVILPLTKGAPHCNPSNAFITVASPEEFDDSDARLRLVLALRAVIRFHTYKTWDFDRANEEFPRYANLMESLHKQAIARLKLSYRKVDGDPVPALTESLLLGARILNISTAHGREDATLIDAMFANAAAPPLDDESIWEELRGSCYRLREMLKTELLAHTGVRQGKGDLIFAVDGARLLNAIRQLKGDWQLKSSFPKHRSGDESIIRIDAHVKELTRRCQTAIKTRREEILSQWRSIQDELGDEFDKQEIVTELAEVIQTTKQFGIKDSQDNLAQLSKLVEDFRDAAVSKCLQHVQRVDEETEGGALLSALAQIDDATLSLVSRFVTDLGEFLDRTETKIRGELDVLGENIVENAIERVETRLRALEQAMHNSLERTVE